MAYRKQSILAFILLLIISTVVTVNVMAQEESASIDRTGYRPDAPTYGIRGSYPVGTRDLVIEGETPLDLTVWYPALNTDSLEESISYDYEIKMDMPPGLSATIAGQAIHEAPADLSASPYPLVVLSPGFSLGRTAYAWLAEHLSSHGFVVIAPEHHEYADENLSDFWRAGITRPQEIQAVLDYVDEQADGTLEGLTNTETVAVIGHSYGGYTSLMMAGARYDLNGMAALCETASETNDPAVFLCDMILPNVEDMADLVGLNAVPEGLWPSRGDSRVDAIVPMAGDAYFFDQAGLDEITIPVMAIGGTADTGTPYLWGTHPTYEYVSSTTKVRVALENAEHMVFGSTCEAMPFFAEIGFYTFCSDPVWDVNRAHDLINHFTTAFLLAELYEDADAAAALSPDAATFIGVTYDAQGF